jgi:hypothetical protein
MWTGVCGGVIHTRIAQLVALATKQEAAKQSR